MNFLLINKVVIPSISERGQNILWDISGIAREINKRLQHQWKDMKAKCPSCESKTISFTTNDLRSERIFSCIDCGNEWNISLEMESPKRSRLRSLLGWD
jgi:DNA-directed RNA polymerase subunit M/transcription elongation factor TFIIS